MKNNPELPEQNMDQITQNTTLKFNICELKTKFSFTFLNIHTKFKIRILFQVDISKHIFQYFLKFSKKDPRIFTFYPNVSWGCSLFRDRPSQFCPSLSIILLHTGLFHRLASEK